MSDLTMGAAESKFAEIIWQNEPISSTELWKIAEKELEWKKSTTFTVLKRLSDKGIFKNEGGIVSSVISKNEFLSELSVGFVSNTFDGSLPAFISSFTSQKKLSEDEIKSLKALIAGYEGV